MNKHADAVYPAQEGTRAGVVLGMRTFAISAPMKVVMEHFGFTVEHVISAAKQAIAKSNEKSV